METTGKHTIGSFLRAVYPGMPDLAAATKSETEVIMDATCELNRIRTLVIKDRDGKVVTQGAFNALECRYYEQLTDISSKDSEIAVLRTEVERLKDLNERAYHDLGERTVAVITLESRVAVLEKVAEYAEHKPYCTHNSMMIAGAHCSCGLDAAKEGKG